MATHSSTLALKIPWTEELDAGYCPWGRKELGTTERLHFTSLWHLYCIDSGNGISFHLVTVCYLLNLAFCLHKVNPRRVFIFASSSLHPSVLHLL